MAFIDGVKERAKQSKKTIVLPEGNDIRVIVAAEKIMKEELADLILIGDPEEIAEVAKGHDISKQRSFIRKAMSIWMISSYILSTS